MKLSRFLPLFLAAFLYNMAISQEMVIKALDERAYPLIKINLEFAGFSSVNINELKVLENNELAAFSLDSVSINKEKRIVSLLVDESLLYDQNALKNLFSAINYFTSQLNRNDLLNIFLAKANTDLTACQIPLSFEYTSDYKLFNVFIKEYFSKQKISAAKPNISCAIAETVDFIESKNLPPGQKSLFIFTRNITDKSEPESKIRQKAENSGITLIQIDFPWNNELAEVDSNKLSDVLTEEFYSIKSNIGLDASKIGKSYIISYYSQHDKKQNTVAIKYKNKTITSSYFRSGKLAFLKENLLFTGIIGGLFMIALLLIINLLITKRQMAKSIIKLKNKKEFEAIDAAHILDEPFHPNKTLYGNGSIIPYVTIDLDGDIIKHELKKLRTTLGRHSDNDILLANLTISNHHAAITNEGGIFYIQDNESTNGTFVNEIKITKAAIKSGDAVRLGKAKLFLTY
ncbi:MAG: FHA domain-containing protein [Bacteroidales bacterium]|nr:FHA domain-containing protein [Bacteroidales bacterium]